MSAIKKEKNVKNRNEKSKSVSTSNPGNSIDVQTDSKEEKVSVETVQLKLDFEKTDESVKDSDSGTQKNKNKKVEKTATIKPDEQNANTLTEKLAKEKKPKLSKFEKRKMRRKKQEDLLNMRGIPKYITLFVMESLYILLVEIMLKLLCGNLAWDFTLLRIFLSSVTFGAILVLFTNNLPVKMRRGILCVCNFLIVFYAWLQLGFLNFLGSFMSVGNVEQGTKAVDYVFEFLVAYPPLVHTIFILFILTIVYFVFERHITRDGFERKIPFKSLTVDIAVLVFLAILGFSYYVTLEADFMQNKYQLTSNKELFINPTNPVISVRNFGTTMYLILDVKSAILQKDYHPTYVIENGGDDGEKEETDYTRHIDDTAWESLIKVETNPDYKTLNSYFINREVTDKNDYTGMFEGKNLVMVMLESISEPLFHEEFKEYFPTFYKLYSEGITAVNNYSPMNNCGTAESERTSQTSVYSIETTCTANTYRQTDYRQALLYMFRENGYYTSTYHDYNNFYYDRKTFEYKFGTMRYYNSDDLGMKLSSEYSNWPSDYEFMKLAVPKFIDKEKFASYMITVTAHTPYNVDSEMGSKNLELFADTDYDMATKRYLSKAKEADLALEHLLDELEKANKLEDTVIVIFGDHYPYALTDKSYQSIAPYDISINNEVDRTPFIIYNSETEPEKITKYTSPMDYTPTLLNLFGIEYDPRYYFGNDIFSDYTDYVLFKDNSWQNASGFYSSSKGEFTPSDEESTLSDEEIIAINKEALTKRDMSALTIKKDYFSYLFKYYDEYRELEEKKKQEEEKEKDTEEE